MQFDTTPNSIIENFGLDYGNENLGILKSYTVVFFFTRKFALLSLLVKEVNPSRSQNDKLLTVDRAIFV